MAVSAIVKRQDLTGDDNTRTVVCDDFGCQDYSPVSPPYTVHTLRDSHPHSGLLLTYLLSTDRLRRQVGHHRRHLPHLLSLLRRWIPACSAEDEAGVTSTGIS
jgi:hypothetical protein